MIFSTARAKNLVLTKAHSLEITGKAQNMEMVSTFGPTAAATLETGMKIRSMESALIRGLMVVSTRVSG